MGQANKLKERDEDWSGVELKIRLWGEKASKVFPASLLSGKFYVNFYEPSRVELGRIKRPNRKATIKLNQFKYGIK